MKKETRLFGKSAKRAEYAVLFGMLVLLVALTAAAAVLVDFGNAGEAVSFFLSLTTLLFVVLLFFFCINSYALDRREKQIFESMVAVFYLAALTMLLGSGSVGKAETAQISMLLNTLLYLFSSLYWLSFRLFQKGKYPHLFGERCVGIIHYVFFGIYSVLVIVNHFTGFCFSVGEGGEFIVRSDLLFYMTSFWFFLYLVIAMTTKCSLKTKLTLASYSLFPLLNWLLAFVLPDAEFYLGIFSAVGIFLYLIPLYLLFFNVYLESGRLFLQRERELEESRANAMALKINPHFIANTMSSIVALCDTEPEKAGELAAKFARYLRDNYTDSPLEQMSPFSQELTYIRNYLAIEQTRFAGLRVEYDVRTDRFLLPTLAVQPLVENAVRHGISKRPDACGTVTIQSFEDTNDYVIRILDDGVGLPAEPPSDTRKHVGIANAKARLSLLCRGTLTVAGREGGGTVCEIRIPKGEKK